MVFLIRHWLHPPSGTTLTVWLMLYAYLRLLSYTLKDTISNRQSRCEKARLAADNEESHENNTNCNKSLSATSISILPIYSDSLPDRRKTKPGSLAQAMCTTGSFQCCANPWIIQSIAHIESVHRRYIYTQIEIFFNNPVYLTRSRGLAV